MGGRCVSAAIGVNLPTRWNRQPEATTGRAVSGTGVPQDAEMARRWDLPVYYATLNFV